MKNPKKALGITAVAAAAASSAAVLTHRIRSEKEEKLPQLPQKNKYPFVFVHGLNGWGASEGVNGILPYWGATCGDLTEFLGAYGYECYSASVGPVSSAWDRACELYAQLYGTKVDYGKVHSLKNNHKRFGRDFSSCPLGAESTSIVLLGHSFGGATVRLLSELMANGDEDERSATAAEDLSPLFKGGLDKNIFSIVTLASPMNGTTAYDMFEDPDFRVDAVKVPLRHRLLSRLMSFGTRPRTDDRNPNDYASFDMHVDNALAMNDRIETLKDVYYFSVPCCFTRDGKPQKGMEALFAMRSAQIGAYTGKTRGGFVIDDSWRENDGLVNTVSAKAPIGAPSKELDRSNIERGVWNVFPALEGDHMWLQGGLMHRHDIKAFYLDLLELIRGLFSLR